MLISGNTQFYCKWQGKDVLLPGFKVKYWTEIFGLAYASVLGRLFARLLLGDLVGRERNQPPKVLEQTMTPSEVCMLRHMKIVK